MSDPHGTPFSTEREPAEDEAGREPAAPAPSPADKAPPPNPPIDQEALDKGLESLDRVKPY